MKAKILFLALGLLVVVSARSQQRLQPIPVDHKWLNSKEVAFTYDGSYTDPECFKLTDDALINDADEGGNIHLSVDSVGTRDRTARLR